MHRFGLERPEKAEAISLTDSTNCRDYCLQFRKLVQCSGELSAEHGGRWADCGGNLSEEIQCIRKRGSDLQQGFFLPRSDGYPGKIVGFFSKGGQTKFPGRKLLAHSPDNCSVIAFTEEAAHLKCAAILTSGPEKPHISGVANGNRTVSKRRHGSEKADYSVSCANSRYLE